MLVFGGVTLISWILSPLGTPKLEQNLLPSSLGVDDSDGFQSLGRAYTILYSSCWLKEIRLSKVLQNIMWTFTISYNFNYSWKWILLMGQRRFIDVLLKMNGWFSMIVNVIEYLLIRRLHDLLCSQMLLMMDLNESQHSYVTQHHWKNLAKTGGGGGGIPKEMCGCKMRFLNYIGFFFAPVHPDGMIK